MISHSFTFHSDFTLLGRLPVFPESAIRDEPSLRGCPPDWALQHGGPIMRAFVKTLPEAWLTDPSTRIRCKSAWLKKGWSGGHVGWHFDGLSSSRADGEEDWIGGRVPGFERISCNMGSNAPTRVIIGEMTLPAYPNGQPLLSLCHKHVEEAVAAGRVKVVAVEEGQVFVLNSSSLHTASPATHEGWRMFFDANRHAEGLSPFPPVEDIYTEIMCDFQATTAREETLMAPYFPATPRCWLP